VKAIVLTDVTLVPVINHIGEMLKTGFTAEEVKALVLVSTLALRKPVQVLSVRVDYAGPFDGRVSGYGFTPWSFVEVYSEDALTHARLSLPLTISPWVRADVNGDFVAEVAITLNDKVVDAIIGTAKEQGSSDLVSSAPCPVRTGIFI
jgi:hypothetical protein